MCRDGHPERFASLRALAHAYDLDDSWLSKRLKEAKENNGQPTADTVQLIQKKGRPCVDLVQEAGVEMNTSGQQDIRKVHSHGFLTDCVV